MPPDNRALTSINISNNKIISDADGKEAGKALGDMLKQNSALKSLDLSSSLVGGISNTSKSLEFVKELAAGIRDNRAMTSLNLASNSLGIEGAKIIAVFLPECT
jgi:hypothetical protein